MFFCFSCLHVIRACRWWKSKPEASHTDSACARPAGWAVPSLAAVPPIARIRFHVSFFCKCPDAEIPNAHFPPSTDKMHIVRGRCTGIRRSTARFRTLRRVFMCKHTMPWSGGGGGLRYRPGLPPETYLVPVWNRSPRLRLGAAVFGPWKKTPRPGLLGSLLSQIL